MASGAYASSAIPAGSRRPLSSEELRKMHAYWRAANYLSVGQIYLRHESAAARAVEARTHQASAPWSLGNDAWIEFHLSAFQPPHQEAGSQRDLYRGPRTRRTGIGGEYLSGRNVQRVLFPYSRRTEEGMRRLFKQFSFPGGIPSHVAPETPGSIHEGGELGYCLAHAYGAAFDNPDLLVCCVVGDGEAETGPLAASWHSNKFLNPARDGAVLPILHLNGYKIANPTFLGRMNDEELTHLFVGYGYKPHFVEGDEPEAMHQLMAAHARRCLRRDSRDSERCASGRQRVLSAVAHDRAAYPERLDGAKDRRRKACRGHLAVASSAALGFSGEAGAI